DPLEDLLQLLLLLRGRRRRWCLGGLVGGRGRGIVGRGEVRRMDVDVRVADLRDRAAVRADGAVVGAEIPEQPRGVDAVVDAGLLVPEDPGALGEVLRVSRLPTTLGRDRGTRLVAARGVRSGRTHQGDSEGMPELVEQVQGVGLDVGVVEETLHPGVAGIAAAGARTHGTASPLALDGLIAVQAHSELLVELLNTTVRLARL